MNEARRAAPNGDSRGLGSAPHALTHARPSILPHIRIARPPGAQRRDPPRRLGSNSTTRSCSRPPPLTNPSTHPTPIRPPACLPTLHPPLLPVSVPARRRCRPPASESSRSGNDSARHDTTLRCGPRGASDSVSPPVASRPMGRSPAPPTYQLIDRRKGTVFFLLWPSLSAVPLASSSPPDLANSAYRSGPDPLCCLIQ
jgi:hypothetical protein